MHTKTIAVVGCGGLGCASLQYLTAAGVGQLIMIDGDTVEFGNLYRQVLYNANDVGKLKCEVAYTQLGMLNPNVLLEAFPYYLEETNAEKFLQSADLVIDSTDNITARHVISKTCKALEIPWIYGSIGNATAHLSLFEPQGPSYSDLFPYGPIQELPSCTAENVIGPIPGMLGAMQALEAIKWMMGRKSVLAGSLLVIDLLSWRYALHSYADKEEYLVDVRELSEHSQSNQGGICIPLSQFAQRLDEVPRDRRVVVYCQSGARAMAAVGLARQAGYDNVFLAGKSKAHLKCGKKN